MHQHGTTSQSCVYTAELQIDSTTDTRAIQYTATVDSLHFTSTNVYIVHPESL